MAKKTDNSNPTVKLALRRYFLSKYHGDGAADVLDCCQGQGLIWQRLRREFALAGYWGVDVKVQKGRLKIDSMRILAQPGWPHNVIDIDTYGSPWKHWLALLPHVGQRDITVFLTIGSGGPGRIRLGREELDAMGISIERVKGMSGAITHSLIDLAARCCLGQCYRYGLHVIEAAEALTTESKWRTRYIGVRLGSQDGGHYQLE